MNTFKFNPKRCILELSYACNLKCKTCTIWHQPKYHKKNINTHLSLQEIKNIQQKLYDSGIERISYLGGEPFLNENILEIAEHAKSIGMSTAVVTNGTVIDENTCKIIFDKNLFDFMIFSIDGPQEIHDSIRGIKGSFKKASDTINYIQKRKKTQKLKLPKVYIYMTVSKLNYECLEDVFRISQKWDANAIRYISVSCIGNSIIDQTNSLFENPGITSHSYKINESLALSNDEQKQISQKLIDLQSISKKIGIKFICEELLLKGKGTSYCDFLGKDFVISAFGDIYPCPMLPDLVVGNIKDITLKEMSKDTRITNISDLANNGKLPVCERCCIEKLEKNSTMVR